MAALREDLQARIVAGPVDRTFHDVLAELPACDRELLLLTYWDGLTSEQAAVVLGIGAATARKRLQRARQRLARHPKLTPLSADAGYEPVRRRFAIADSAITPRITTEAGGGRP